MNASSPLISTDVNVRMQGHVAVVELRRPPHNFFDGPLLAHLATVFERLNASDECRSIVLCAVGKAFCAGADFGKVATGDNTDLPADREGINPLYLEALRLFACEKPVVAAIHGPAIGGGLGLALVADFRVTCPEARFSVNFNRLGFHPGFGISTTLPRLIGFQKAALLLYTGRRIDGEEALAIGLADELVAADQVRDRAILLATEIAASAPLAVVSTRTTLRSGLLDAIRQAVTRESAEQRRHFATEDFREGVAAMAARREPAFTGH